VEGDRGGLDGQTDEDGRQDEAAGEGVAGQGVGAGQLHHVEGVRRGGNVEADEPDQQRQRPEEGVEEELQGRPSGVLVTPSGDDEVHADDREVEEDEEEDEVRRDEQAERDALQEEEQRAVQAGTVGLPQRVHGAGEEQGGRHHEQRKGEPVDADVVAAADTRDPGKPFLEGERPGGGSVVARPDADDEQQVHEGHGHPRPPGHRVADAGDEAKDQCGGQGQEDDEAEHAHLTTTSRSMPAARTAAAWT